MRYDGNMKGEEKAKVKQTGQTKRNKVQTIQSDYVGFNSGNR